MNELHRKNHAEGDVMEIDLVSLAKAIWKRLWIVIVVALICGSAFYFATRTFIMPTYQTQFSAYVNNRNSTENATTITSSDLLASQSLASTYAEIISSRTVLEAAAQQAGLNYLYEDLANVVSTQASGETEIITTYVVMEDPQEAVILAEAIAAVAPRYVSQIVEGTSMQIIDNPVLPVNPVGPNAPKNALIGFMLGAIFSSALIVIKELIDDTVKEEDELESRFGIPIIGTIPDILSAAADKSGYGYGRSEKQKEGVR